MRIFIIICDLLIPALMLGIGIMFSKKIPSNINGLVGYRTSMSMKNDDTWQFANQYCGKLWFRLGLIMTIFSALCCLVCYLLFSHQVLDIVSLILIALQTIGVVVSIAPVEKALRKTFDEDGKRLH
ncbi:putative membrane protein [Lachnospiraceae bacterium KM106-2]|nr:putative membrane protein [Lachnospiraceae bacterium KM106-2]